MRSNYLNDGLKKEDGDYLFREEKEFFIFIHSGSKEYQYLNEQTFEANRIQRHCYSPYDTDTGRIIHQTNH